MVRRTASTRVVSVLVIFSVGHFEHMAVDGFAVEHRRRSSRDAEASQCYRDGKLRRHSKRLPDIQRAARAPAVYSVSLAKADEGTVGNR